MIYNTGTNVTLIHKAEYCKSIIADGKELITGNERGELVVPELNDEKVYITFKEDLTSLANAFTNCKALKSIPENLFANCPEVTTFAGAFTNCVSLESIPENLFANCPEVTTFANTFNNCESLESIPENLFAKNPKVTNFTAAFYSCSVLFKIPENIFANCPKVTSFSRTFEGCMILTSESPYTMIDGQKVHLYERKNYPEHFTKPTDFFGCFYRCISLTDYKQIPSDWK